MWIPGGTPLQTGTHARERPCSWSPVETGEETPQFLSYPPLHTPIFHFIPQSHSRLSLPPFLFPYPNWTDDDNHLLPPMTNLTPWCNSPPNPHLSKIDETNVPDRQTPPYKPDTSTRVQEQTYGLIVDYICPFPQLAPKFWNYIQGDASAQNGSGSQMMR